MFGVGCSDSIDGSANSGGTLPTAGSAGAAPDDGRTPKSLDFEMAPELAAREQLALKVRALPARSYEVLFVLPMDGGDPLDAVLDRSSATTDQNGVAQVLLTAPSSPTTFQVRAIAGGRDAVVTLSVTDRGLATLQVSPSYPSLLRDLPTWIATAHVNKTCADVPGIPPPDGELKAPLTSKDEAPVIERVPAGTPLAVTLRSGHFAGGCTSVDMLPPGPPSSPQIVQVTVLNRPIDLSASSLSFSLSVEPGESTWGSAIAAAGGEVQSAMFGDGTADDAAVLLKAMRDASGSPQEFQDASEAEGWSALLRSRWGQKAPNKLHDVVTSWLSAGRQSFVAADHAFTGRLKPLSEPTDADGPSSALLSVDTVAGLDAESAGFVDGAQASWRASADDTIVLSTDVYFSRTELAAGLAEAAAVSQAAPTDVAIVDAPSALSAALDCRAIAAALAGAGTDATLAYAGCDADCLAEACDSALEALWRRGAEASGTDYSRLSLTATSKANVGDEASVKGFAGTWLGELSDTTGKQSTHGAIVASALTSLP